ncbi:hypothetical protein JOC33_000297 [Thalassobacillus pellis]|nr:hypothetical protein [Thalassobacillus pellis]
MPPFTKEDAVDFVTNNKGFDIESFPEEIGKRTSIIEGYQVIRETSAEEINDEVYLVSFTEHWSKGSKKGSWTRSYKVGRGSLTAKGGMGELPPYYGNFQY